ncbi:CRS2-associated factor 1 [Abeliophyllum distichum]|uniref:CRS2-associated factor 1 n=1 Tax=Abeliophyllum distichum TaxID=126358 RepID=A0ABD1TFA8_9LAMI
MAVNLYCTEVGITIPREDPVIPLMLWKPQEPVYPRLIKTTIDGLNIEETKKMRKRGLSAPALTKLAKNGYYGSLVPMVRDAFLTEELVRIDCKGLQKSDYKKIGCKLRDLVPCILVTFEKEQIVIWRGRDYKPTHEGYFLTERESFSDTDDDLTSRADRNKTGDDTQAENNFDSGDSDDEFSFKLYASIAVVFVLENNLQLLFIVMRCVYHYVWLSFCSKHV